MIVFNVDIDNTLIYSHKKNILKEKFCVDIYENREISFMTKRTHELLLEIREKIVVVPTTTRTVQQYKRINFNQDEFKYALTCNGSVLLIDGEIDEAYYNESQNLAKSSQNDMKKAIEFLNDDPDRDLDIRFIENLFVYTKTLQPEKTFQSLTNLLNTDVVDVLVTGNKIYVVPKTLNKGENINRFRKILNPETVLSAGDSNFDIPMLNVSDFSFAPFNILEKEKLRDNVILFGDDKKESDLLFSEEMLLHIKNNFL